MLHYHAENHPEEISNKYSHKENCSIFKISVVNVTNKIGKIAYNP
jgi:hypothetical protein